MRQVPSSNRPSWRVIFPYFIVIILDCIGFGIVNPILAPMVAHAGRHESMYIAYGFILSAFPLAYLFGAPILGWLSDQFGRKRMLWYCLLGTLIGFIGYVVSFWVSSILLLLVARIVAGFTSGSQGIAQAAMADISNGKEKVRNIALVAVALTIGFILGPLVGGVLSDKHLVSWFSPVVPCLVIVVLAVLNLLLLQFFLKDTRKSEKRGVRYTDYFCDLIRLCQQGSVLILLSCFFIFELGWSLYYQSLALLLALKFHFTAGNIGFFSAYVGIGLAFSLLVVVRILLHLTRSSRAIIGALSVSAIVLLMCLSGGGLIWQVVLVIPVSFAVGIIYANLISMVSDRVDIAQQGLLMGVTDSLLALAFSITGLASSWLAYSNVNLLQPIAGVLLLLALLVFLFYKFSGSKNYDVMS